MASLVSSLRPDAASESTPPPAEAVPGVPPLGRGGISLLAAVCGVAVANNYYVQPLLVAIGRSLAMPDGLVSLMPALTQIGVAAGVLFLVPLGDVLPVRRLLTVTITVQSLALAAMAAAPNGPLVIAMSLCIGFFGITSYILQPYTTMRTPAAQRGHVTALLSQGILIGMLLARSVSGFIGLHFGWRVVYAGAAVLMILLLLPLRRVVEPLPIGIRISYPALLRSLAQVFRTEPGARRASLCQALNFGSFSTLWVGLTFQMESPAFGWHSDGVGALAVIGAAAAGVAPLTGRLADRKGPRVSLLLMLSFVLAAWVLLGALGFTLVGMILGLVLLDIGSTSADISNRTIVLSLHSGIRTRLMAIYVVTTFIGGGVASWATGLVWSLGGWHAVCALGGGFAVLSMLVAYRGVGKPAPDA